MSFFYFKKENGECRVLDVKNYIFSNMSFTEQRELKFCYEVFQGYEASDDGIKAFGKDFRLWCSELRFNKLKTLNIDYKTYYSHPGAVQCVFKRLCKGKFEHHQRIIKIENTYFQKCFNGGLSYCTPGIHECYGFDFSGFYPSLLADMELMIPNKPGKESTFTKLPQGKKLKPGFYRVKITCNVENFKKIFAFSRDDIYTHTSLQYAMKHKKEFNVSINLIIDDQPNAYIYRTKDMEPCGGIFGKWHERLICLKKEFPKNKLIKHLTSSLWGHLTQYNKMNKTVEELDDGKYDWGITDAREWKIVKHTIYDDRAYYTVASTTDPFKYALRIMPFLLAHARNKVGDVVLKDIDHVVRVYSDNVTFNRNIEVGIPNMLPEGKTTGTIEWKNARFGKHICHKCDGRYPYAFIADHIKEC